MNSQINQFPDYSKIFELCFKIVKLFENTHLVQCIDLLLLQQLFDATEKLTQAPSRPPSSALSAQQRLLGSPPPSAFRKSAVGIKSAKIWNSTQSKRDTPTPGPQCPVKIVSPDEDGSNTSKPRQRTSSTMSVLSGRSRNPSVDGFKEVTFVQTLSAPSTAMRSLSRASLSNNNLTPPPRVVGVSIDGAAGSLDYVQVRI